jgi:hypothetical protein
VIEEQVDALEGRQLDALPSFGFGSAGSLANFGLEIKRERIHDVLKRANVETEFAALRSACEAGVPASAALLALRVELRAVKGRHWQIEDEIRD